MVRPKKRRCIYNIPKINYFKPSGIFLKNINKVELTFDEVEAIRLFDLENLNQIQSSNLMQIHQSTFNRILNKARKKIADALLNGKAIKINGGEYNMPNMDGTGPRGFGKKRHGQPCLKNNNVCSCPNCNIEIPHIMGLSCEKRKCPECGSFMIRKDIEINNKEF